ncbi:pyruvate kinase [Candidatus Schneideria nysicola]|uniref:pyruvate kinase n=1 Tax=Candidatus Schneideria nysicola TaxID=1081631 RepID=UPI001CAA7BD8|nr:pyruvate kinase [Candidatus Schneideria nysicola]UAJ65309.1 pyruvate kinase [Candidatus Schneideria nysicola]
MSRRFRRTKIVVTLGPSTDRGNILERILIAGANVVRLNFSHGTMEEHLFRANKVRNIAAHLGKHIAILGDLQGPKIRITRFQEGKIFLKKGDTFSLDASLANEAGNQNVVGIDYKDLPNNVMPGDILLLDDGRIRLKVIKVTGMKIYSEVLIGGVLSNNKGINKLGGGLSITTLTDKDKMDILTATKIGVDYLAISFPRTGEDVHYARQIIIDAGSSAKIVSKFECAEAVSSDERIDDIILASDVVMVARGDLGIEISDPELVGVQKKIIRRARTLNRAVITATQMMESMILNPTPTRAEVMDVANAVLDGTDAVMLSAETASGNYPEETVLAMSDVCLGAERIPSVNISKHRLDVLFNNIEEAIALSAMYIANHLKGITAIISMTKTGRTSLIMSRISSGLPIFALSRYESTLNLTSLYRGVIPILAYCDGKDIKSANQAANLLCSQGLLFPGDLIVVTQSDEDERDTINRILVVE